MFICIAKVELSVSIPLDIVHKWWQMLHIMVESSPAVSPHQGQQYVWHMDLSQDPLLTFVPMCFSKMFYFVVLLQDIFNKSYRLNPTRWDHGLYQKLPGLVGHQRAVLKTLLTCFQGVKVTFLPDDPGFACRHTVVPYK